MFTLNEVLHADLGNDRVHLVANCRNLETCPCAGLVLLTVDVYQTPLTVAPGQQDSSRLACSTFLQGENGICEQPCLF